jgi:hypothetical protein
MLFAKSTGGFYTPEIHGAAVPKDSVVITDGEYSALMAAQAVGMVIAPDKAGRPVAIDPPKPTRDQAIASLRAERDRLLAVCDWTQMPDVSLTVTKKAAWAVYRQALRDLPAMATDPANPDWPTSPA